MNETECSSQLSALFDGELPTEQAGMVIRRALKDSQLRATWGRYALIGAAIRNEPLAVRTRLRDDIAARVAARLAADPASASPQVESLPQVAQRRSARAQFARGAWGMALAASVAVVSLVVMRSQTAVPVTQIQVAQSQAASVAATSAVTNVTPQVAAFAAKPLTPEVLPSYTTPVNGAEAARFGQPLVNYVVAHSEVVTPAVHLSPLSSMMNAGQDITAGTVEMTKAEIAARQ
jgi:negative regulator of sigma E activity